MVDLIEAPLAAVAGTVLSASMFTDMSPLLQWSLAAIGGGGSAGLLHGGTAVLRGASSASTGGVGNPLFSIGEDAGAVSVPILAILVPVFVVFSLSRAIRRHRVRDQEMDRQAPPDARLDRIP